MAQISKKIDKGPIDEIDKQLSTCLFCSKEIKKGGCWHGEQPIGVCEKCSYYLIDLLVDTLNDTNEPFNKGTVKDKMKYIEEIGMERIIKKEEDKKKLGKYSYLKKLGLKYYAEMPPIDFFDGTMTTQEVINKCGQYTGEVMKECENEIKEFIKEVSKEIPHTIRFFAIPDLHYGSFKLGCVAKIHNNGATYILCGNEAYIDAIDEPGYRFNIKSIY
ncbi:hypothetical protein FDB64_10845 [Clostridium botulinum]|uniref:hypothetical protein n=1 Tax=Clostridium botulinum TaxID=1491 RepID=UPI0013F0C8FF|nr:hypothetical protein [Clostridium botulinum]MBN1042384.1 hypothetical protein [Clostridium botulinum]MBN1059353.1 hypothetical protein [Clostridium botulinum]NFL35559.1 hypothetical protein [Clostridium botulinum]NFM02517.1 hypothetical protein [Clostridium botulinum]